MKFKHVKDALRGKDRRIEELEEALRFCQLACESVPDFHRREEMRDCLWTIRNKCELVLLGLDNS